VDNLRLWNVADSGEDAWRKSKSGVQFKIIPGHHGGYISQMREYTYLILLVSKLTILLTTSLVVDPGCKFLISASSNRGWHGDSTRTVFVHEIKNVD
jgi:transcriptional activator SPT8